MDRWLVQLYLPWFSPGDEELQYASMTLGFENSVDKRLAFRIMRRWYKDQIGRSIHKRILERIWKRRNVQKALTAEKMDSYLDQIAGETYEAAQSLRDCEIQEGTTREAEL